MRILIAHNRYQQRGGEDVIAEREAHLFAQAGHDVEFWELSNFEINDLKSRIRTALQLAYSVKAKAEMSRRIVAFQPDVVQVHNFFPLLTPSIYDACQEAGVPVVQTLHNYRLDCAGGSFLRNGKVCEDCLGASPYQAVLHRCYRGSFFGSLAVARMINHHRRKGTWQGKVDLFFALSCFMRDKFVTAGLPASRIVIKPNFALTASPRDGSIARSGALFVGRLTEEKGLRPLIEAWRSVAHPLRIAGDGPLNEELRQRAPSNVQFIGWVDQARLHQEMNRAAVLIVPSTYYVGFPLVIAEAYAHGLPVLASRIGTLAEIVREGETGALFSPGDPSDIARCANENLALPTRLQHFGEICRQTFDREYSAEAVYRIMLGAYSGLIASAKAREVKATAAKS